MNKNQWNADIVAMLEANDLPKGLKQILIENQRLNKRIQILQAELSQKGRIIQELKFQMDNAVIEETKNKLTNYRIIEQQIQQKTAEIKQKYIEDRIEQQKMLENQKTKNKQMIQKLATEEKNNQFLRDKIVELKQHIINIIDQKDFLILQLAKIIEQSSKIEMTFKQQLVQKQKKLKKNAVIKRNG